MTVVAEVATGLYLLAGVLSVVVSWAQDPEKAAEVREPDGPTSNDSINLRRGLGRLLCVFVASWCLVTGAVLVTRRADAADKRAVALLRLVREQEALSPLKQWRFLVRDTHPTADHSYDKNGYPTPDLIFSSSDRSQRRKYVDFGAELPGLQFPVDTPDEEISQFLVRSVPETPTKIDMAVLQREIAHGDLAGTRAAYEAARTESSSTWQVLHIFSSGYAAETVKVFLMPLFVLACIILVVAMMRWVMAGFRSP